MFVTLTPLPRPMRFVDAEPVLAVLRAVTHGWNFAPAGARSQPFLTVARNCKRFTIVEDGREAIVEPSAVSAACSIVAIALNRMIREDRERLCLHAAAVTLAGRTLVFPATHRAGKSTLAAALCLGGAQLLAEDILPVEQPESAATGTAAGVSPRLRLPLAWSLGPRFVLSARLRRGPDDGYYRYIRLPTSSQLAFGVRRPLGAFVFLQRTAEANASLGAADRASAMRMLLRQNFGVAAEPATVLSRIEAMADRTPAFVLRYRNLSDAASLLRGSLAPAVDLWRFWRSLEQMEVEAPVEPGGPKDRIEARLDDMPIAQRKGVVLRAVGQSLFLADNQRGGIFNLDPLGAAIWQMLDPAATAREITDVVSAGFPDQPRDRIAADIGNLLREFLARGLADGMAQRPDSSARRSSSAESAGPAPIAER